MVCKAVDCRTLTHCHSNVKTLQFWLVFELSAAFVCLRKLKEITWCRVRERSEFGECVAYCSRHRGRIVCLGEPDFEEVLMCKVV